MVGSRADSSRRSFVTFPYFATAQPFCSSVLRIPAGAALRPPENSVGFDPMLQTRPHPLSHGSYGDAGAAAARPSFGGLGNNTQYGLHSNAIYGWR